MIIEFTVGNFLSFKESATLSMVASALKEKHTNEDDLLISLGDVGTKLLKSAIIYGANASGKSNFIKALSFCRNFIVNSSKQVQAGDEIDIENFRLSDTTRTAPSNFEVIFTIEDMMYRYGFELDTQRVHKEWLFCKKLDGHSRIKYTDKLH